MNSHNNHFRERAVPTHSRIEGPDSIDLLAAANHTTRLALLDQIEANLIGHLYCPTPESIQAWAAILGPNRIVFLPHRSRFTPTQREASRRSCHPAAVPESKTKSGNTPFQEP